MAKPTIHFDTTPTKLQAAAPEPAPVPEDDDEEELAEILAQLTAKSVSPIPDKDENDEPEPTPAFIRQDSFKTCRTAPTAPPDLAESARALSTAFAHFLDDLVSVCRED